MSSTHLWVAYVLAIVTVAAVIYATWNLGRIYRHLGQPAWKAWVPGYNVWVFFQLGQLPGCLLLFPLLGFYFGPEFTAILLVTEAILLIVAAGSIVRRLGGSGSWTILFILSPWLWIVGLGYALTGSRASEPSETRDEAESIEMEKTSQPVLEHQPEDVFFDPNAPDDFDITVFAPTEPVDTTTSRYQ